MSVTYEELVDIVADILIKQRGSAVFVDNFWGRAKKAQWTTRVTTGAVGGAPSAPDLNGVLELLTAGGGTDEESLDWNDLFCFDNTLRPAFECRIYIPALSNNINIFVGLVDTATGNAMAELAVDVAANSFMIMGLSHTIWTDTLWHLHSADGSGTSDVDAGAQAVATTWTILRFEYITDTSVEWFIDGVSQGIIDTNVATANMQPLLFVLSDAGALGIDIDYVKIWQDEA